MAVAAVFETGVDEHILLLYLSGGAVYAPRVRRAMFFTRSRFKMPCSGKL